MENTFEKRIESAASVTELDTLNDDLKDILTPAQLESLVDAFRQAYQDGKEA